jgi:hypothetical protein
VLMTIGVGLAPLSEGPPKTALLHQVQCKFWPGRRSLSAEPGALCTAVAGHRRLRSAPGSVSAREAPDEDRDQRAGRDIRAGAGLLLDDEAVLTLVVGRPVEDEHPETG